MKLLRSVSLVVLLATLAAFAAGCGGDADAAGTVEPDQAVIDVARGLADGRPEVAWQGLPPSYRAQVTDLVHLGATKMDADVWNRSFGLLQKLTRLAKEKRDYILSQPMWSAGEDRAGTEAGWNALVGALDALAHSELADLNKVKKLDVEAFLAGTGGELMKRISEAASLSPDDSWSEQMSNLRRTKATVVSRDDDGAVLRVETPGKPAVEETYVLVEDCWVPKSLADAWPTKMAEARKQIEQMSTTYLAENKQTVLMQLAMAEGVLDTLLGAESQEQFNAALAPVMGMAMGAMMARSGGQAPPAASFVEPVPAQPRDAEEPQPAGSIEPSPVPGAGLAEMRNARPASDQPRPDLHAVDTLALDEAPRYVGRLLRVTTNDGVDTLCRLKDARSDALVCERTLGGGSISFEVPTSELERLELAER